MAKGQIKPRQQITQCYNPNGSVATDPNGVIPCQPNENVTFCCASRDMCSTNGLCKSPDWAGYNQWSRGSCSDPTWSSPDCPQHCTSAPNNPEISTRNWWVRQCTETTYCCAANSSYITSTDYDCCRGDTFEAGPPYYLARESFSLSTLFPATFTGSATSRASTSNPTAATTSSPVSTSANPTASTTPSVNSGLSSGAQAGIGVGVALGVLAIIGIAVALWFRRKKSRQNTKIDRHQPNIDPYKDQTHEEWKSTEHTAAPFEAYAPHPEADSNPRAELDGSNGHGGYHR